MTLRDQVWNETLSLLRERGKFKISDLPFGPEQRHTARRVLREMEDLGWLSRENQRAATWRMGEKAKANLNVSTFTIQQSEQ